MSRFGASNCAVVSTDRAPDRFVGKFFSPSVLTSTTVEDDVVFCCFWYHCIITQTRERDPEISGTSSGFAALYRQSRRHPDEIRRRTADRCHGGWYPGPTRPPVVTITGNTRNWPYARRLLSCALKKSRISHRRYHRHAADGSTGVQGHGCTPVPKVCNL